MLEINWNPSRRELRQFAGIWLPAFAALVAGAIVYRGGSLRIAVIVASVAAVVAVVGLASPRVVKPVFVGWMVAAYPIGWTVSHVVLAIAYYGLFTVLGLIMRISGYDPLQRKTNTSVRTYWAERRQRTEPSAYFRQF